MAKIFVSVPVLDRPELRMMYSMYQAILTCKEHQVRLYFNQNDSLISRVRNVHMSVFYHDYPEYEYFISLDSDLEILNTFPYNNIFTKLISHNVDFVGGLYAVKNQEQRRCASISHDGRHPEFDSGLIEMRWLSSGCWCIHRSVVEKMIKAYPELTYDGDDNAKGKTIHGLYIPMIYDMKKGDLGTQELKLPYKKYLSEDWAMTQRWRDIGGKIYADTSIVLKHIGKHDFTMWNVEMVKKENSQPSENLPPAGFDLEKK